MLVRFFSRSIASRSAMRVARSTGEGGLSTLGTVTGLVASREPGQRCAVNSE